MKAIFSAVLMTAVTLSAVPAAAQDTKPAEARDREMAVKPELPREVATQLGSARRLRTPACTTQKVAFHASGNWHGSAGADVPLAYPSIVTNVGNAYANFFNIGIFTAPCDGQYFFTVTFVKDSYYVCGGNVGTTDDVSIYLTKGSATPTVIDPGHSAWSGEGAGRRGTGVYSVVLTLLGGDQIATWVHSDGGPHRCLASYQFTGFRVTP
jgi:hypothetical protein